MGVNMKGSKYKCIAEFSDFQVVKKTWILSFDFTSLDHDHIKAPLSLL